MENNMVHPTWLPQINCPYKELFDKLTQNKVPYKVIDNVDPNQLKPLQQFVNKDSVEFFNNKINNRNAIDPVIVSADDEIIDGHHRVAAFKMHPNVKLFCIKVYLPKEDASRVLNKIQDRYDFENKLEETIDIEKMDENKKTHKLYSVTPLNEKKISYLQLEKMDKHNHEYDVTFDKLYEISEEEYSSCIKEKKDIFEYLAEKWHGKSELSLSEEANKHALPYDAYVKKKIYREAKNQGYDGIKFGNKFIQTIP